MSGAWRYDGSELWVARRDGSAMRRLLETHAADDITEAIVEIDDVTFSNDQTRTFFTTEAWTTSDALHVVDVASGVVRFVSPANSLFVPRTGPYAGCLIVTKHKYFPEGGSYDFHWLVADDGREIGMIAYEDDDLRKRMPVILDSSNTPRNTARCQFTGQLPKLMP